MNTFDDLRSTIDYQSCSLHVFPFHKSTEQASANMKREIYSAIFGSSIDVVGVYVRRYIPPLKSQSQFKIFSIHYPFDINLAKNNVHMFDCFGEILVGIENDGDFFSYSDGNRRAIQCDVNETQFLGVLLHQTVPMAVLIGSDGCIYSYEIGGNLVRKRSKLQVVSELDHSFVMQWCGADQTLLAIGVYKLIRIYSFHKECVIEQWKTDFIIKKLISRGKFIAVLGIDGQVAVIDIYRSKKIYQCNYLNAVGIDWYTKSQQTLTIIDSHYNTYWLNCSTLSISMIDLLPDLSEVMVDFCWTNGGKHILMATTDVEKNTTIRCFSQSGNQFQESAKKLIGNSMVIRFDQQDSLAYALTDKEMFFQLEVQRKDQKFVRSLQSTISNMTVR